MKEVKSPKMDELELTRRAFGEPPEDPEARARARARLRAVMHGQQPAPGPARRFARMPLVAALVAALVLAGILVVPFTRSSAVAEELRRLREVTVAGPVPTLGPGEVFEVHTESMLPETQTMIETGVSFTLIVHSRETYVLDRDGSGLLTRTIDEVSFATPADQARWSAAGSPEIPEAGTSQRTQIRPGQALWLNLQALSIDPTQLLVALRSGAVWPHPPGDDQVFGLIGMLFERAPIDPAQRLALLDVIGQLDDVRALGDVSDPTGRIGVGFSVTSSAGTAVLIFDPRTAQILSSLTYPAGGSLTMPTQWVAYRSAAVVIAPTIQGWVS